MPAHGEKKRADKEAIITIESVALHVTQFRIKLILLDHSMRLHERSADTHVSDSYGFSDFLGQRAVGLKIGGINS